MAASHWGPGPHCNCAEVEEREKMDCGHPRACWVKGIISAPVDEPDSDPHCSVCAEIMADQQRKAKFIIRACRAEDALDALRGRLEKLKEKWRTNQRNMKNLNHVVPAKLLR